MAGDHGGGIVGGHDDDDDDDDDDNRGGGGAGSDDDAAAVVLLLPVMGTLLHAAIRLGVCSITLWISKLMMYHVPNVSRSSPNSNCVIVIYFYFLCFLIDRFCLMADRHRSLLFCRLQKQKSNTHFTGFRFLPAPVQYTTIIPEPSHYQRLSNRTFALGCSA